MNDTPTYRQLLEERNRELDAQRRLDRLAHNIERFLFAEVPRDLPTLREVMASLNRMEEILQRIECHARVISEDIGERGRSL